MFYINLQATNNQNIVGLNKSTFKYIVLTCLFNDIP